jgi:hypothetical protein
MKIIPYDKVLTKLTDGQGLYLVRTGSRTDIYPVTGIIWGKSK